MNINIENLYNRNIDIDNRTIFFMPWQAAEPKEDQWEVSDLSAQNLVKGLYLLSMKATTPITIIWNSHGGTWEAGMAIYDLIKKIPNEVIMECYGRVRSMGTIILQACDERLLSPNCQFMIHYGESTIEGESRNVIADALEDNKCNKIMEKIYLKRIREKKPGTKLKELRHNMQANSWLEPKGAISMGLADGIIT